MNNPNDNVKSQPGKKLDISPELYFKNWAFEIGSHYWEVFGVTQREWIDQAKAKPLREKRKLELISQTPDLTEKKAMSLAVKQIRPKVKGWGKSSPDKTNFSQGYLFKHKSKNYSVQILGIESDIKYVIKEHLNTSEDIPL